MTMCLVYIFFVSTVCENRRTERFVCKLIEFPTSLYLLKLSRYFENRKFCQLLEVEHETNIDIDNLHYAGKE